ncbi:MAG: PDZ domain-containing protein [Burkholderiales bacterium]|nr:PDZ domain-containing protein [Anaerolineae bacterium]
MQNRKFAWGAIVALLLFTLTVIPVWAQDAPAATIINDDGGPVVLRGEVAYTNPFFTDGVAEPMVILEDQGGMVERDYSFRLPLASQTIGQITSDFFTSPFNYSLALPIEPQGSYRDVDNDGETDQGVQVFAVAYWTNTWGDPFLEERDLYGAAWSTAYASTRISENADTANEVVGGKVLVYAADDEQGFPSGFGDDDLIFTDDDPIVTLPQGYTLVDMDSDPFIFDRSRDPQIDLIEPEGAALDDFSGMSYTDAFDAMIDKMRHEYAFTEYKDIDWDAMIDEFRPRFAEAEANNDAYTYLQALRDFSYAIPDGHVRVPLVLVDDFQRETGGGLGIALRTLDDERVIVSFVTPGSAAEQSGIQRGTEIIAFDGTPIDDVINAAVPWSSPFSTDHARRLQQERYATRFVDGTQVEVTYQNESDAAPQTVMLTAAVDPDSFTFSAQGVSFSYGLTGFELPVEYNILPEGVGYAKIFSFQDDARLSIELWERMIATLNAAQVPALIVDMRQNGGGSPFLAGQMAAYFFDESIIYGNAGTYDEERDDFFFDPAYERRLFPPPEELRYHGDVIVLVGPTCASACEGFSYAMTLQDRATIMGQFPTAGLGGGVEDFMMPEDQRVRFTVARGVDADGNINIEGIGVVPTVHVPVDEETVFSTGDPILEAALDYLITGAGK